MDKAELRATDKRCLLETASGGPGGPAVAEPCALDELAQDDWGGGQGEVEGDDGGALTCSGHGGIAR